ncbi:MAG: hypothetical protein ACREEV_00335, partial [Dongiaceae bacterium]
ELGTAAIDSALSAPPRLRVQKPTVGRSLGIWIDMVRPSRRPLRGLLRMRNSLIATNNLPHPEERPKGASRRTHSIGAGILSAFLHML